MPTAKLSKSTIDALPSPTKEVIWWDAGLRGFGLKLTPAGRKVFLVQYRPTGDRRPPRKYTIGEYGRVTPHQARAEAQRVLAERAAGRDPQAERRASQRRLASDKLEDVVEQFLAMHVAQNRTAAETTRILRREVLTTWTNKTIAEVSRRDVIELLDRVRDRGAPIMANRVLAAVRKFFAWCVSRGLLDRSPCAGVMAPARERSRHRVLDDDELRRVLVATSSVGEPFGGIVRLLALTGQRREEVGHLAWSQIVFDRAIWVIPADRTKNGKPHLVHLSERARELLAGVERRGEMVFSRDGQKPFQGYSKAKARLDQLSGVTNWTLHDLRRTVVSGMARLGVAPHVADKILNHQSGTISGVAAVYQRHEFLDERRDALNRWGAHLFASP